MNLRIVFIVSALEPRLGLERAVIDLAHALVESATVEILCIGGPVPSDIDERVGVSTLGMNLLRWRRVASIRRIRRWLRRTRADQVGVRCVYVACGVWTALPALLAGHRGVIVWEHSLSRGRTRILAERRLAVAQLLARSLYPRAPLVVAVSEALANDMRGWSSRMSERVISIPNVVNQPPAPLPTPDPDLPLRVLAVGSLTQLKNQELLVDAMKHLPTSAKAWIVGSGPYEVKLRQRIQSLGLADRVLLKGFQDGRELVSAFRWANVFAHPSLSETFGMVLFEAAHHGLPVVALDRPVMADVVGSLVPGMVSTLDPASFGNCLKVVRSKVTEGDIAEGKRLRAEYCSSASVAARWMEALQE